MVDVFTIIVVALFTTFTLFHHIIPFLKPSNSQQASCQPYARYGTKF